jgi:hypothetical protein
VKIVFSFYLILAIFTGCAGSIHNRNPDTPETKDEKNMISEEEALEIAGKDAANAYVDLSGYEIKLTSQNDRYIVEYLPGSKMGGRGGGPYYEISKTDGSILEKIYYQ